MHVQKELVENVLKKLDKTAHTVYAAERIAQRWGVILVRQPPYHCQYNGIELIWAWMKKVKTFIHFFPFAIGKRFQRLRDVLHVKDKGDVSKKKVEEQFMHITPEMCKKYVDHAVRVIEVRLFKLSGRL